MRQRGNLLSKSQRKRYGRAPRTSGCGPTSPIPPRVPLSGLSLGVPKNRRRQTCSGLPGNGATNDRRSVAALGSTFRRCSGQLPGETKRSSSWSSSTEQCSPSLFMHARWDHCIQNLIVMISLPKPSNFSAGCPSHRTQHRVHMYTPDHRLRIIKHPLYKEQVATAVYQNIDQLEDHINRVYKSFRASLQSFSFRSSH